MCVKMVFVKSKEMQVPCGKCPECVKAKYYSWLFRLDKELERSDNPLFVTLTMRDEHITWTNQGNQTLCKRDLQLFFKKLRKKHAKTYPTYQKKIKYYAVGEYGSRTKRPHYHIILYNVLDADMVHNVWGWGHTMSPQLSNGGTNYVLKYLQKPPSKKHSDPELQREFSLMSKNMGDNYLTPEIVKHHQNPKMCFVRTFQGFKMPIPKYYKEKMYDENKKIEVRAELQNRMQKRIDELIRKKQLQYPNKTVNDVLNLIDDNKKLIKFDTRKNEVL